MASKTVFVPDSEYPYVKEIDGYSDPEAIRDLNVLEISTRSEVPFGKIPQPFQSRYNIEIWKESQSRMPLSR